MAHCSEVWPHSIGLKVAHSELLETPNNLSTLLHFDIFYEDIKFSRGIRVGFSSVDKVTLTLCHQLIRSAKLHSVLPHTALFQTHLALPRSSLILISGREK